MRPTALLLMGTVALSACAGAPGVARPGTTTPPAPSAAAPALIQVENSIAARPQSGLSGAAIVYEYLTEGGISRFSALFTSPPHSRVGPIRSARLVSIALARMYGAVLIYSGASSYVSGQVGQSGIPYFTEVTAQGALFRTGDRGAPHNLYTDGSGVSALLQRAAASRVSRSPWPSATGGGVAGTDVSSFTVPISFAEQPVWTYDAAARGYTRREPSTGEFLDAATGEPVVATTVIVQQVNISQAPEIEDAGSGAHGVEQQVTGTGRAQVFTGGKEYDATWTQGATGPPALTLTGGGAAPVATGLVWIELVPTGTTAS